MMKLLIAMFAASVVTNAFAGEGEITFPSTHLKEVAIIGTATGGHAPGDMEITLVPPISLPFGVNCSRTYITTKQSIDPDRTMTDMLLSGLSSAVYVVHARITDNPSVIIYPGRCSLEAVGLELIPLQ